MKEGERRERGKEGGNWREVFDCFRSFVDVGSFATISFLRLRPLRRTDRSPIQGPAHLDPFGLQVRGRSGVRLREYRWQGCMSSRLVDHLSSRYCLSITLNQRVPSVSQPYIRLLKCAVRPARQKLWGEPM